VTATVPPGAIEAAAKSGYERFSSLDWDQATEQTKASWKREAEAHLAAALPSLREVIAAEVLGPVRELVDAEIADDVASNVRHARANVRCLDCNLRYEERENYSCGEPSFGHDGYTDEMLADAEAEGRAQPVEYVTISVADLRAALPTPVQAAEPTCSCDRDGDAPGGHTFACASRRVQAAELETAATDALDVARSATELAGRYAEAIKAIAGHLADGTKGGVMRARVVIAGLDDSQAAEEES
jgi:hypothetical protein